MLLPQSLQASGELQASSINAIKDQLLQMLQSKRGDDIIRQAVSEVVSKRQYDALMPEDTLDTDELMQALAEGATLQADYSNRLLYSQTNDGIVLYANGQRIDGLDEAAIAVLVRLANGEHLNNQDITDVDTDDLSEWLENGWVWIDIAE
jgi:50S ribosomal protein L16 3-hydroxylase